MPDKRAERQIDASLIQRCHQGDKEAFSLLVLKYQKKLAAALSRWTEDRQRIQDWLQETFIKAYQALPQFKSESSFYTWLYAIACNVVKNAFKKQQQRDETHPVGLEYFDTLPDPKTIKPEWLICVDEYRRRVLLSIGNLPLPFRIVLILSDLADLDYQRITELTETPIGTVRSRLARARMQLKALSGQP